MPLNMQLQLQGTEALQATLRSAGPLAGEAMKAGLYEAAESIMTEAKSRTPVDTGTLVNSGAVLPPVVEGTHFEVTMGFGGAASDYALIQHENLEYHHNVGQAKYLEGPVVESLGKISQFLNQRLHAALARMH